MAGRNDGSAHIISLARSQPVPLESVPDSFTQLAHDHGLLGLMVAAGEPLKSAAQARHTRLLARQAVMVDVLRRILHTLDSADIPASVLKGPRLAHHFYGQPSTRTFTDVDVLVRQSDVERTLQVLGQDPAFVDAPSKWPKADKRNVLFRERGVEFTLDLHWDLFSHSQLQPSAVGATGWAWTSAEKLRDSDLGSYWVLPAEVELAFLCAHSILDHRFRLILFRDIAEVTSRFDRWNELTVFTTRWGLRAVTYAALFVARQTLGAQLDPGHLARLRPSTPVVGAFEMLMGRVDPVTFDGHSVHPLNLVAALLGDSPGRSVARGLAAPLAFRRWRVRTRAMRSGRHQRHADLDGSRSMILLVSGTRRRGGEVFGSALAHGFSAHGWKVTMVAINGDSDGPSIETDIVLRSGGRPGRFDLGTLTRLRTLILEERPDVVFANGGSTLRHAVLALWTVPGRPRLVYSSIGEPAYWLRGRAHRVVQGVLHRSADLVLAVSEATRQQVTSLFGVPAHRATVAHTGVAPEFFEVPRSQPGPTLNLLFLGSLSPEKNPLAALEVAASVAAAAATRIRFVGSGPLAGELEVRAEALGIRDRVEIIGSVGDVRPQLEWADLLLMTSRTEGFPGAVLEAAAAGVPTVGFDVGGIRETVLDGTTGLLAAKDDLEGLATIITELAASPERIFALGGRAREWTRREFPLDEAVAWYVRVVSGICQAGTRAGG